MESQGSLGKLDGNQLDAHAFQLLERCPVEVAIVDGTSRRRGAAIARNLPAIFSACPGDSPVGMVSSTGFGISKADGQ